MFFRALRQDAAGASEQVAHFGLGLLGQITELARHFALHATHARAQGPHGFPHALELLGVGVAPDLGGQPRCDAVVVLVQAQAMFLGHLYEVLSALLQQAAVGGMGDRLGHDGRVDAIYDPLSSE